MCTNLSQNILCPAEDFLGSYQVWAHEFNRPRSRRVAMKASGVITVMPS
jgi:hypothetical protein